MSGPCADRLLRRGTCVMGVIFCLACSASGAATKEQWTSIRSAHYLFVGDASATELRRVAVRFEQFRAAFAELFPAFGLNAPVPTRVVVFSDDKTYSPFRPLYRKRTVAFTGYFQAGLDTNYIALPLGLPAEDLYALPQHESVHLLIGSSARQVPDWLNEGLAQYYSTFALATHGGLLGTPIQRHVEFLREHRLLTLAQLFQIERGSADYVEDERNDIFYAESWALVHYLISGNAGRRQLQLLRFMEMLAAGLPVEHSFEQAFHADYQTIEAELTAYIARGTYPVRDIAVASWHGNDAELHEQSLTEAGAQYYLGDL
ncbi:MAG TPA: DUF1570 domain-containing protein, partial [Pyrinomonadaceae bacterium]|nr:DUF1570 domain-containing protein [Pyrinomonadaceae bacterium]